MVDCCMYVDCPVSGYYAYKNEPSIGGPGPMFEEFNAKPIAVDYLLKLK